MIAEKGSPLWWDRMRRLLAATHSMAPVLTKGKLLGPAGSPCLVGQLEGGDTVSAHALIRQTEQEPLGLPSLQEPSLLTRGLLARCKPLELTRASP